MTTLGTKLAGVVILGSITAGAAGCMALTGVPAAGAATCTHTRSQSHVVTARGTQTWTQIHETKCGKAFEKWTDRVIDSYTGAHSDTQITRNEWAYPHWSQRVRLRSVTAKGVHTYRVTVTRG